VDMFRLKGRKVYSRGEYPAPGNDYETRLYSPEVLISENKMSGLMQNLFVKSAIVQKNNIRFTDGLVMLEDQEFTAKCMIYSSRVLYYTKENYLYYQRDDSVSKNFRSEHFPDILICAANVYQCAENRLEEEAMKANRGYAYQKALQYLKIVFKDPETKALSIREDMEQFLKRVDFDWSRNITLQFMTCCVTMYKGFKTS
jgi:hypothetical protein